MAATIETPELGIHDFVAMARRRMWWIIVPAIVGPVLALGLTRVLPPRFRSQTLVLVEQQRVPDKYVTPVVTEQLNRRLTTLQEQILSGSRLQPIIERFDLYKQDRDKVSMDELVSRLRSDVEVTPIRPQTRSRDDQIPGFYVAASADSPRTAQLICGEIVAMFTADNLRAREQQAQGTTDFLASQLADAKANLDRQDAVLAQFKRQHLGQLPSDQQQNTQMLATLGGQLEVINQSLAQAQQQKALQESLISQQSAALHSTAASETGSPIDLQRQLSTLRTQLADLEVRYTKDHPDVRKLRAQVSQLERDLQRSERSVEVSTSRPVVEPPELIQLRAALRGTEINIAARLKEQDRLTQEIKRYQDRLQLSPLVEEQYKQITRDYETALQFYNDLLSKKTESEMATKMERQQQGEQFRVMDPPNLPGKPDFPDRVKFAGGGLGGGMVLGIGMAFLLEMRQRRLWNAEDVEKLLRMPVLSWIPELRGKTGKPVSVPTSSREPKRKVARAIS